MSQLLPYTMSENQEYQPLVDTLSPPPPVDHGLVLRWAVDQVASHHSVFSYIIYLCICIHYTPRGVIFLCIYLSINLSFESLECELLPIYQSVYLKVLDEGCYLLMNLLGGVIHVPICPLWKFWVGLFRSSTILQNMCVPDVFGCVRVLLQMQACYRVIWLGRIGGLLHAQIYDFTLQQPVVAPEVCRPLFRHTCCSR